MGVNTPGSMLAPEPDKRRQRFAMRKGRNTKIYVVPTADLRKVEFLYIPADGKYAGSGKKPRRDWTHYENAWHLLGRLSEP